MFHLKVEIVLFGVRTKSDLFENNFLGLRLDLLLLLFLLVLKLRVINNLTYWRICIRRDFDEVEILFLGKSDRLLNRVNINFDVLTYYTYTLSCYPFIDTIRLFRLLRTSSERSIKRSIWSVNTR